MNPDYMESVIWAFKQLYDKGLVYEGFRVLPYCWNDETPLSNHELRMDDDVYQIRAGPGGDGRLAADQRPGRGRAGPGLDDDPVDAAVQPRGDGRLRHRVRRRRVGRSRATHRAVPARRRARLAAYARELRRGRARAAGRGAAARAPTWWAAPTRRRSPTTSATSAPSASSRADLVTTTDGTGLVHTAGAFGEVDKEVTDREGIEPVMPVGKDGRFTHPVDDYAGMLVFDANLHIIDHLKAMTAGRRRRPARSRPARCCCAARPTTTPTRTAGAAASR